MNQSQDHKAHRVMLVRVLVSLLLMLCMLPQLAYAEQELTVVDPDALLSEELPAAATAEAEGDPSLALADPSATGDELLYAQTEEAVTVKNLWLYDLDGTEQTLSDDYNCQKRYVVVGRTTCGNTQNSVSQLRTVSQEDEFADISFLVLDVDGDRATFLDGFGSYETDRLRFFSSDTSAYSSWAFWAYGAVGNEGSSVTLPFTVLIDKSNHVQAVFTGVQDVRELCRTYLSDDSSNPDDVDPGDPHQFDPTEPEEPEDPNAYDELSFSVWGTADMQSGRELLPLVNEARAAVGVGALTWDADLEKTAQQRGAEQMVLYSHTRPDGTRSFTAWPSRVASYAGENIAYGQTSVSQVNADWTNSSGHYKNMIDEGFTTFAAAHFVSEDGEDFWVECFGSGTGTGIIGTPVMGRVKTPVDAIKGNVHLYLEASPGTYDDYTGELDRRVPELKIGQDQQLVLAAWHADIDPADVVWTSSDPSVVRIGEDGVAVGVSAGTATVTAAPKTYPGYAATADVTVTDETYEGLTGTWGTCPWEIDDEGTLTIYPGTGEDSEAYFSAPVSYWIDYAGRITSVRFVEQDGRKVVAPENCVYLFGRLTRLVSADLTGLDTSQVTTMHGLFARCSSLQTVKLAGLDTSKVADISRLFLDCTSLKTLDLSMLDVSHASQMYYVFQGCTNLEELNVSGWDTSAVIDMDSMFKGCASLKELDLSSWDTTKLAWDDTDTYAAQAIFDGCTSLASLRVGPNFVGSDERVFPDATASNGLWWSAATHEWLSKSDIVANLLGQDNLYTNYENWDYQPPSKDLSGATVSGVPSSVEYTGEAVEPAPVVTYSGRTLVAGTDYTLAYENNTNAGTATMTVRGTGNYTGSVTRTFTIRKATLTAKYVGETIAADGVPEFNVTVEGFVNGETPETASGYHAPTVKTPDPLEPATTYVLSPEGGSADNYTFEYEAGNLVVEAPEMFFVDITYGDEVNHADDVEWMGTTGISTGWVVAGGREYRGNETVKRCDLAAFLYRLAGCPDFSTTRAFKDVKATTPHYREIAWMAESGISRGWSDDTFRPMNEVARQDMAAFLYRFADLMDDGVLNDSRAVGNEEIRFVDVHHGDESNHAKEIEWLASVGVTKGWLVSGGAYEFRGLWSAKRQDMAAFLHRLTINVLSDGGTEYVPTTTSSSVTVTFTNGLGGLLKVQTAAPGTTVTPPANPTRTGYTFAGWDREFANATSDITVNARWNINKYTVTFTNGLGTVLKTQTVNYGASATAPASPTRTGYTFAGWDRGFSKVAANITVNAKWTAKKYTVTFTDGLGKTLKTQSVSYGGSATAPASPSRSGYTFNGWDRSYSYVTSNLTINATWKSAGGGTVYITRTGSKYHRDGCSSLSRSKIPISLQDAIARGYGPCKNCNPPTL